MSVPSEERKSVPNRKRAVRSLGVLYLDASLAASQGALANLHQQVDRTNTLMAQMPYYPKTQTR
jgi:hypothetical protein